MSNKATVSKAALGLLAAVIAATDANGNGFVAAQYAAPKELIAAGLIEVNSEIKNEAGEIAARVTDAGRKFAADGVLPEDGTVTDGSTTTGTSEAKPATRTYSIDDNVPLPEKERRTVQRNEQYPFSQLAVGQSFFVADSEVKSGNAAKSLASTVSTANQRYSVETGEMRPHKRNPEKQVPVRRQERKFEIREMENNGVKGARIFRVEVTADETAEA